jgi:drug/metabolite transporter (DMT)-like permease
MDPGHGWVVLQERLRGLQWSALVVGVVGMVLIVEPWRLQGVVSSLFALAAALCFAGGAVVAKVLRRRHEVDLLSFTVWQGLLGSLPLVVLAAVFPGDGVQWAAAFVWALAYSVLIGTALAQVLWLHALHLLPATTVGFANLATPIVSVLVAWLQLSERPSAAEFAGMLLVVAALGLTAASARGTGSTGTRRRVGETLCSEDPPCSDRRVPSGG